MYQALYRKYRPRTFSDVSGQEHITEILKNQIISNRVSHAYMFTGTRGTGKTSSAKILAKAVNCLEPIDGDPCNKCFACTSIDTESSMDAIEIDAASNNKVDDIRQILEETRYQPGTLKKRVYIIDEVHMLTTQAFNALLKTLEEPPAHVLFILATTEIHKVLPTILSRCQRFDFKRITQKVIEDRLRYVAETEGFEVEDDALKIISKLAEGGLRDALSILDRCLTSDDSVITAQIVCQRVGNISYDGLISVAKSIKSSDAITAIQTLDELYNDGIDLVSLLKQLLSLYRDILVSKITSDDTIHLMYGISKEEFEDLVVSNESIEKYIRTISDTLLILQRSQSKKVDIEICVITLCKPINDENVDIVKRMRELEDKISNFKPTVTTTVVEVPATQAQPVEKLSILEVKGSIDDNLKISILKRVQAELPRHVLSMIQKSKMFFEKDTITIVSGDSMIYETLVSNKIAIDKQIKSVFKENINISIVSSKDKKVVAKDDGKESINALLEKLKNENVQITEED